MCILHLNRGRSHFNLAPWYCLVGPSSWVTSIKLLPSVYKQRKIGTITLRGKTNKKATFILTTALLLSSLRKQPTISPRNDVSVRKDRRNSIQFSANQKHYQDLGSNASSPGQTALSGETCGDVTKCLLFYQPCYLRHLPFGKNNGRKESNICAFDGKCFGCLQSSHNSLYETLSKHGFMSWFRHFRVIK